MRLEPTEAMRAGLAYLTQCSGCGLLAAVVGGLDDEPAPRKLGACPACGCEQWWRQELPVGPFIGPEPDRVAGMRLAELDAERGEIELAIHAAGRTGELRLLFGVTDAHALGDVLVATCRRLRGEDNLLERLRADRDALDHAVRALEVGEGAAWEADPLYCGVRRTVRSAQSEEAA